MATMRDQLQLKIADLVAAINACVAREGYKDVALRPHPPASMQEIDDYEAYLGVKLPHSYREFLLLYNGYDWLAYPGHMLSIESVMPEGHWYDEIVEWKRISAEYGSGEVIDVIVIANMGQANSWAYLLPDEPSGDDELTIVVDLNGDFSKFANLLEVFDWCIKVAKL
jgi:cell wall assembly regulator SMI1